jgi:DNA-directed RNA polymerase subunit M/transcription elongation factor TFIIS
MSDIRLNVVHELNEFSFSDVTSQNIERSIYNYVINYCRTKQIECCWDNILFKHVYVLKSNQTIYRLRNSPTIRAAIMTRTIDPKTVGTIHFEEFFPNMTTETDENLEQQQDGMFKCRRCGGMKTTYYSLQTRSSDEPMTCFVTCTECKNRWKC